MKPRHRLPRWTWICGDDECAVAVDRHNGADDRFAALADGGGRLAYSRYLAPSSHWSPSNGAVRARRSPLEGHSSDRADRPAIDCATESPLNRRAAGRPDLPCRRQAGGRAGPTFATPSAPPVSCRARKSQARPHGCHRSGASRQPRPGRTGRHCAGSGARQGRDRTVQGTAQARAAAGLAERPGSDLCRPRRAAGGQGHDQEGAGAMAHTCRGLPAAAAGPERHPGVTARGRPAGCNAASRSAVR